VQEAWTAGVAKVKLGVASAAFQAADKLDDFQRSDLGHALQGLPQEGMAIGGTKAGLMALAKLGALESATAKGVTVLGHAPEYKRLGDALGARTFSIPEIASSKMSAAQVWAADVRFLDRTILRGDEVILSNPLDKIRPGSYLAREVEYLGSKGGYVPNADGTRLFIP